MSNPVFKKELRQPLLTTFVKIQNTEPRRAPDRRPRPGHVVCLGGDAVGMRGWTRRGFSIVSDIKSARRLRDDVALAVGVVDVADLSVSGARWWKKKMQKNPHFQEEALQRLVDTEADLKSLGVPWFIITAASPIVRKRFRAPNAVISPHEFGEYLNEDDFHPTLPDVVPARDAYTKRTFVYHGCNFLMPRRRPVAPVFVSVRKKSGAVVRLSPLVAKRSHAKHRKLMPRGFLEACAVVHSS